MSTVILRNPDRPPGKWFNECVESVRRKSPGVDDPNALCGWVWYHHMSQKRRKQLTKKYEKRKNPLQIRGGRAMGAKTKSRAYVGVKNGKYQVFRSIFEPTRKSHGAKYTYVIGPFRTMRGAEYMAAYGRGNPHLQTVEDAERLSKKK